jgi:hypothetical protein
MTTLEPHPHILSVRVEKHGKGEPVHIITTDLNINSSNPAFDRAAFDTLVEHVAAWQRRNVRRATIEGPV